jgi:hypothetical protein
MLNIQYRIDSHHNIGGIVVEDCRDILSREGIGSVADQQASFTYRNMNDIGIYKKKISRIVADLNSNP